MSMKKALESAAAKWGSRDFTGSGVLAAVFQELELGDELKKKIGILLEPYKDFGLTIPGGNATSFNNLLSQSQFWTQTGVTTTEATGLFKKALRDADSLITGNGVVKFYGEAQHTKQYAYIAKKFDQDHLAKDKAAAKVHAQARLSQGGVPASTSVLEEYANALNDNAKALNEADVYKSVEWYLNTVKGWTPSDAVVDTIGFFSKTKVTAYTYTLTGSKLNETKVSGHLMYAAQADEENASVRLIYHYSAIEPTPNDPSSFERSPKTGSWKLITYDEVAAKLPKLDEGQKQKLKAAWPLVYYAG